MFPLVGEDQSSPRVHDESVTIDKLTKDVDKENSGMTNDSDSVSIFITFSCEALQHESFINDHGALTDWVGR